MTTHASKRTELARQGAIVAVWRSAASDEAPRGVKAVRVWFPSAAQALIGILRRELK